MRRETPSLALLLVGAWIMKISLTDDYKMYVKDSFGPWLAVAGGILVLVAIAGLVLVSIGQRVDHAEHADHPERPEGPREPAAEHGHSHRSYVGWLLLAPLVAFTVIIPRPLGAYSAERAAAPPPMPADQTFEELPAGDPVELTLRDYTSRTLWDDAATLEGRTVRLTGFVTPRAAGGYYITRQVIACCAADALPVQVYVAGDPPVFAPDTWIEVVGTSAPTVRDESDSFDIAAVTADSVTTVTPPASPYEQ